MLDVIVLGTLLVAICGFALTFLPDWHPDHPSLDQPIWEECPRCEGMGTAIASLYRQDGVIPAYNDVLHAPCAHCNGTGRVAHLRPDLSGVSVEAILTPSEVSEAQRGLDHWPE
jgi:hypothetical protein